MYSLDLKEKVIKAQSKGWSWKQISEVFNMPMSSCQKIIAYKDVPNPPSYKSYIKVKGNVKKCLLLAISKLEKNTTILQVQVSLQRAMSKSLTGLWSIS
jgi:hypothetical protein